MDQIVLTRASELADLNPSDQEMRDALDALKENPRLTEKLQDDRVSAEEKKRIAQKLFPECLQGYLLYLAQEKQLNTFPDIAAAYTYAELQDAYAQQSKGKGDVAYAEVEYVTPLTDEQIAKMKGKVRKETGKKRVELELRQNKDLIGGFILHIDDQIYDYSTRKTLQDMRQQMTGKEAANALHANEIISVLKTEIEDFDRKASVQQAGTVLKVGDGIATVRGLQDVMYNELVEFENGVRGIVQNLEKDSIGVVLLGSDYGITEKSKVLRTKKRAGVGVGPQLLGRVVNALGAPIDGEGPIETESYYAIEREAPGVADREPVSKPLQTGILSIDAMFPIGRGQRELLIGDRQTGKTSVAVDTIINQKGQDVICIYVAIGQKNSTVASIVSTLKAHDAMDYTIVVNATASDPAPVQYIAPYAGTAMAEYFMDQGKDVLIVYDDLSKHAVAYRAMSLLLHRPPGREAYPGDVFYLHSRLLERACRLDEAHGGGSITALPIIETQAGDVSAYIPTNVISITDGQIFFETELFNSGMRPAVNVGLSVSRVGGAAQTKAMKTAVGQMRIDLAQYRELEVFTQFSSDLDATTRATLDHGKILMELLKQPLYHPYAMWEEVVLLYAATRGMMDSLTPEELPDFRHDLLWHVRENGADLVQEIQETGKLTDEAAEKLTTLIQEVQK